MRRAGYLFEQVAAFLPLCAAARRAARGKVPTGAALDFLLHLEPEVLALERELIDGCYRPRPYRTFRIRDPKPRLISAAAFRDRVVHHAVCAALEPVFERHAIFDTYACRPGKGGRAAIRRAQEMARREPFFLKLDIEHFFETASHAVLKGMLRRVVKDVRMLDLVDRFVDAGAPGAPAGVGLPIGNLTSQHFANFYLGALDRFVKQTLRLRGYVRYMDDILCFGPDAAALRRARAAIGELVEGPLALRLKASAERSGPVQAGVPFLGMRIWPHLVRFDAARVRRFRRRFRALHREFAAGARSEAALQRSAESLVGWAMVADTHRLRGSFFERLAAELPVDQARAALGRCGPAEAKGEQRRQPGEPGRQLEQRRRQPARGEPEQQLAVEPEQQPRVPPGQLPAAPPEGRRLWTAAPCDARTIRPEPASTEA